MVFMFSKGTQPKFQCLDLIVSGKKGNMAVIHMAGPWGAIKIFPLLFLP